MSGHMETMGLTRVFIDNTQDPAVASFECPVMDKIQSPYMSWIGRLLRVFSSRLPQSPLLFLWRRDQESLLPTHRSDTIITGAQVFISHKTTYLLRTPFRIFETESDNGLFHNNSVW